MIPLRDENPTHRPPVVTVLVILGCVATFLFVQPSATRSLIDAPDDAALIEEIEFSYEHAAIPCELIEGRPLSVPEVLRTLRAGDQNACITDGETGRALFPDKSVFRSVLVSMFLHADWFHLAGNMVFLWVFGNNIEDHMGAFRYAVFYVAAGVVATAAHVLLALNSTVPLVGASGAIAGVMGAYLVWFPWARVRTIIMLGFIPVWPRIPAAVLLVIWFATQFWIDPNAGVAWAAHVGGFVFGAAVAFVARRDPHFRNRLWAHRYRATGSGGWDNRTGPRLSA